MDELVKYLLKQVGYVILIFAPVAILIIGMKLFVPKENYMLIFTLIIILGITALILIYDRRTNRPISYSEEAEAPK
jgi:hypothetical protein